MNGILSTLSEIVKIALPSKVHAASLQFESFLTACNSSDASKGTKVTKGRVKLSGRLAVLKLNGRAELEEVEEVIQELLEALGSEVSLSNLAAFFSI